MSSIKNFRDFLGQARGIMSGLLLGCMFLLGMAGLQGCAEKPVEAVVEEEINTEYIDEGSTDLEPMNEETVEVEVDEAGVNNPQAGKTSAKSDGVDRSYTEKKHIKKVYEGYPVTSTLEYDEIWGWKYCTYEWRWQVVGMTPYVWSSVKDPEYERQQRESERLAELYG